MFRVTAVRRLFSPSHTLALHIDVSYLIRFTYISPPTKRSRTRWPIAGFLLAIGPSSCSLVTDLILEIVRVDG